MKFIFAKMKIKFLNLIFKMIEIEDEKKEGVSYKLNMKFMQKISLEI